VSCSAQHLLVCLSVCFCTGFLKKLWMDPDEILWTGPVCDKDELFTFWIGCGSDNFLSDSSPLRDRAKPISQKVVYGFG